MTSDTLRGRKVAILVADHFEQAELGEPLRALREAGAQVDIVSGHGPRVHGLHHLEAGDEFDVDVALDDANPADYDALVLPGGTFNADALRLEPKAQAFAQAIQLLSKPIGVICHGPWLLVSSGLVGGRTLTSWPSLKDDIGNAGGQWVDREVVVDGNLVSSRKPDDLPAFTRELVQAIASSTVRAAAH